GKAARPRQAALDDEHGARGPLDHLARYAAEQDPPEQAAPTRPHHDGAPGGPRGREERGAGSLQGVTRQRGGPPVTKGSKRARSHALRHPLRQRSRRRRPRERAPAPPPEPRPGRGGPGKVRARLPRGPSGGGTIRADHDLEPRLSRHDAPLVTTVLVVAFRASSTAMRGPREEVAHASHACGRSSIPSAEKLRGGSPACDHVAVRLFDKKFGA